LASGFLFAKGDLIIMASSNQAARVPESRSAEVNANARPLPKPETKPTKFVIKLSTAIPS
jgi:hypothetical protein